MEVRTAKVDPSLQLALLHLGQALPHSSVPAAQGLKVGLPGL